MSDASGEASLCPQAPDFFKTQSAAFKDALAALDGARAALIDAREQLAEHFPDVVAGLCEPCGEVLLFGELGHRAGESGIVHCTACAPTWGDGAGEWAEPELIAEDPDEAARIAAAYAAHLAAGGKPKDKWVHAL